MKSMFAWAGALVGALSLAGRGNPRAIEMPLVAPAMPFDTWSASSSDGIPAYPHRRSYLASRREARRRRNARRGGRR